MRKSTTHTVQISDRLFRKAVRRAQEAGFATVDEFVADRLESELSGDPKNGEQENFDQMFTPERLAHIDKAQAEISAGKGFTRRQAEAELAKRRAQWIRKNPR
jgi:hypothetical protein